MPPMLRNQSPFSCAGLQERVNGYFSDSLGCPPTHPRPTNGIFVAITVRNSTFASGGRLAALGLRGSIAEGLRFGLVSAVPMATTAALVSEGPHVDWSFLRGIAVMPFTEEVLFRGVFVLMPVALGDTRFWPAAILSGLLSGRCTRR